MKRHLLFLLIPLLFLSGCTSTTSTIQSDDILTVSTLSGETNYPITITDMNGDVTIDKEPTKIVSLSPSNTETIFALNAQNLLVGRTNYDNYPPEAQSIEIIGDYASPSVEKILQLQPDLVIASDFIDQTIKNQLEATGAKVLVFSPTTISQVEQFIIDLGQVVNKNDKAAELIQSMQDKYQEVIKKLESKTEDRSVFIDLGDYYSVGTDSLIGEEINLIGATNIAADSETAYPQLSTEAIIAANPDVYFSFLKTEDELKAVSGFDAIEAFKDGLFYYYPDTSSEADIMKRPGPRVIDGFELLAKDIYPECF